MIKRLIGKLLCKCGKHKLHYLDYNEYKEVNYEYDSYCERCLHCFRIPCSITTHIRIKAIESRDDDE